MKVKLVKGKRYKVKFRVVGSPRRKPAEFVATALSPELDGRLAFSGRPAFGTAYIYPAQIISAEVTTEMPRAPR